MLVKAKEIKPITAGTKKKAETTKKKGKAK